MKADSALANLEAYERWAENYPPAPHNPLMRTEQEAMVELLPTVTGAFALDLACGTGRYGMLLAALGAARVVGMDFSTAMLRRFNGGGRVRGDMMKLPFAAAAFDLVVSGLAVGHAPGIEPWMREVARVLKPNGVLLYSDFHPQAAAAGMKRSFKDENRRKHTLLHRRYGVSAHRAAAISADLEVEAVREVRVGEELRERFPGSEAFYRRWQGLPVVLIVRARKAPPCKAATTAV